MVGNINNSNISGFELLLLLVVLVLFIVGLIAAARNPNK
jgi:hypothetical protein